MTEETQPNSPRWSRLTKQVVALTLVVLLGAFLVRFKTLIIPVLLAFMVAYVLHPPITWISRRLHISWKLAVNIVYLLFVLILLALLTWGGVGLVGQVTNLIETIQENITELPAFIENLTGKVIEIGPFKLDLSNIEWGTMGQQVLGYVEPALGKLGSLIGSLAGSAATTIGWLFFIILISYFFTLESGGLRNRIIQFDIPVFAEDFRRMGQSLGRIWNAYLRGQLIIVFTTMVIYSVVLTVLGVRYSIGLAILAGLANFLPYIGPAITWIALGLVTSFQGGTILGLTPFWYTVLVLGVCVLIDQIFNNLINPRIMSNALKVHPAFVLIAAIIGASLLGVVGVILAAPLLASLQLAGTYIYRKMLDRDPWPDEQEQLPAARKPGVFKRLFKRLVQIFKKKALPETKPQGENHGKD